MSIGSGSAQDGQELCCPSCGGYHGNFPDWERVNASPTPAAIVWPSVAFVCLFVCVGDASLFDRKGVP